MTLPTREEIREATRTDVRWVPVKGFEHDYDVNNNGTIRRRSTNNILYRDARGTTQLRKEDGTWVTRSYSKLVEYTWGFRNDEGKRVGQRISNMNFLPDHT